MHFKLYKNEVFARIVKRTLQYSVLEWSKKTIAFWTRNTFCRMGVCPMQLFHFWSRDVHPGQNLLLCTKFHENRMFFFTEIWRYINFQNGGRPPSWNCFTTIRDHPRSLCCWPQLPVKFHVNPIHRFEDIAIWMNFSHIWLEMPIQAPKVGVWRDFGPLNVIIHHHDPQKAHSCVNLRLSSY